MSTKGKRVKKKRKKTKPFMITVSFPLPNLRMRPAQRQQVIAIISRVLKELRARG